MVYVIQVCWQLATRCTNFLIHFGIKLYMFRTVSLSIIRSFLLYTQQYIKVCWQLATRCTNFSINFAIKLCMFRKFPLSIISSFSLYTQQWYMSYRFADSLQLDALISQIYFWNKTLHVSDTSPVHHQQFFTVHTAMVYVIQFCWQLANKLSAKLYDIYRCCV